MSTTKTNAAKLAPRLKMLDEIATQSDAVLMGMGDCHHGSACSLTEVWELEQRGVPVAYVDTPRRVPRVEKDGDVFVIDYFMLEKRVPRWKRQGMEMLRSQFELQGSTDRCGWRAPSQAIASAWIRPSSTCGNTQTRRG